jgi:uncharacterized membrane protein
MTNDHFQSLDETVRAIRADCEARIKAMSDRLMAAEIEATFAKEQLNKANERCEGYMRIAERLVTQFSTVEKVFAEAKEYALMLPEKKEEQPSSTNVKLERDE